MIAFECPHCGNPFKVQDKHAGRDGWCRVCKRLIIVPDPNGKTKSWSELTTEERCERLDGKLQYAAAQADFYKLLMAKYCERLTRIVTNEKIHLNNVDEKTLNTCLKIVKAEIIRLRRGSGAHAAVAITPHPEAQSGGQQSVQIEMELAKRAEELNKRSEELTKRAEELAEARRKREELSHELDSVMQALNIAEGKAMHLSQDVREKASDLDEALQREREAEQARVRIQEELEAVRADLDVSQKIQGDLRQQLRALAGEVESLKVELDAATCARDVSDSAVAVHDAELESAQLRTRDLNDALAQAREAMSAQERDLKAAIHRAEEAKRAETDSDRRASESAQLAAQFEERCIVAEGARAATDQTLKQLREQNEAFERDYGAAKQRANDLAAQLNEVTTNRDTLRGELSTQISDASVERDRLHAELERVSAEAEETRKQLHALVESQGQSEQYKHQLIEDLTSASQKHAEMAAEAALYKSDLQRAQSDLQRAQNELGALSTSQQELEDARAIFELQLEVMRGELDDAVRARDELAQTLERKDAELAELLAQLEREEAARQLLTHDLQVRSDELQELNGELQTREDSLLEKDSELRSKSDELRAKDDELFAKVEELQARDELLREKDEDLRAKDGELRAKAKEVLARDEELHAKDRELAAKDGELRERDSRLETRTAELVDSSKRVELAHANAERLERDHDELSNELRTARSTLESLRRDREYISNQLESRIEESGRLTAELDEARAAIASLESRCEAYTSQVEALTERMDVSRQDAERAHAAELQSALAASRGFEAHARTFEAKARELESTVASLESRCEAYASQVESLTERMDVGQQDAERAHAAELASMGSASQEFEAQARTFEMKARELESTVAKVQNELAAAKDELRRVRADFDAYKAEIEERQSVETTYERDDALDDERDALGRALSEAQEKMRRLERELSETRERAATPSFDTSSLGGLSEGSGEDGEWLEDAPGDASISREQLVWASEPNSDRDGANDPIVVSYMRFLNSRSKQSAAKDEALQPDSE